MGLRIPPMLARPLDWFIVNCGRPRLISRPFVSIKTSALRAAPHTQPHESAAHNAAS